MAKLSGWQRFPIVLIGTWMLSVAALSTYEYATSKDGTFIGLVFPLKSIISAGDETDPDGESVEERRAPVAIEAKSRAIEKGREPEIATERFVRWRILVGALVLPFVALLGISLLSKLASRLSTDH